MSVRRSAARRLVCSCNPSSRHLYQSPKSASVASRTRSFTSTCRNGHRKRPHYPSLKAEDLQKIEAAAKHFRPLEKPQRKALETQYTPQQLAAVDAAERSIDPKDLATQMKLRSDTAKLDYFDDLRNISPVIDKRVPAPDEEARQEVDAKITPKSENQMAEALWNFLQRTKRKQEAGRLREANNPFSTGQGGVDWDVELNKFMDDPRNMFNTRDEQILLNPVSALQPDIPRGWNEIDPLEEGGQPVAEGKSGKGKEADRDDELLNSMTAVEENDARTTQLKLRTGLTAEDIARLKVKNLICHRVVNQTRMGKIGRMYYLTIAGNGKGMIGIGEGKSVEAGDGRKQAFLAAIRNMQPIPRYENRTIYGEVDGKVGATELRLSARPPGFGIRTSHLIFEVARAAGIADLSARVHRARNPMNTVKATVQALLKQRIPEEIALGRGRKMVDVRKVYYGGRVY